MNFRGSLAAAAALGVVLALGGCGEEQDQPPRRDATQAPVDAAMSASSQALLDALNTPQLEGGRLVPASDDLALTLEPGSSGTSDTRVRNEGDTPVTISSIETALRSDSISFGDGCRAGTVLQPSQACDLFVSYRDSSGHPDENEILILSDARKTPSIRIALSVDIEAPQVTAPGPDAPLAPQQAAPAYIPYAEIAAANQLRRNSGWGGAQASTATRIESTDDRYAEEAFEWTEASLPVDRRKVLTSDRVIKAVLETPFNNIMCSQVVAVTDSDTWGADQFPGTDTPLLPAGTRFVGTCNAFTDERAGIVWTRFITPDGRSARIVGAANDAMGRGGLPGHLDRRWFDKYGVPIIFSTLRSTLEYLLLSGQDATTEVINGETGTVSSTETPESKAIDRFQGDMDAILGDIMDDLSDTREVLTIPGGTRIDIVMLQDVYFKDPRTVVMLGDDEYELPKKERQQLYRTQPQPMVAGAPDGAVAAPQAAQTVVIDGKEYWLTPARPIATDPYQ